MKITRKPSRKQLLLAIGELQTLIGDAIALHNNDRNRHGFEQGQKALAEAFELCIDARSFDPIQEPRS
jgi:hypothetical protein